MFDTSVCAYIYTGCHLLLCGDWPNAHYGGCTSYIHLNYLQHLLQLGNSRVQVVVPRGPRLLPLAPFTLYMCLF